MKNIEYPDEAQVVEKEISKCGTGAVVYVQRGTIGQKAKVIIYPKESEN